MARFTRDIRTVPRFIAAALIAGIAVSGYTCTAGRVPDDGTLPNGSDGVATNGEVSAQALPALPAGWPTTLQLGMADAPGGAEDLQDTAPFGFRYQYLAGGVNTGNGWANWNPGGQFVSYYIQDSLDHNIRPVFTYYMIFQSTPGNAQGEYDGIYTNLNNTQTMLAYFNDLKLFFQRAAAFPQTRTVLHVEPDLWGYIQQYAQNDNAASVPVRVASSGMPDLAGLPNTAQGLAQAIDRLRDTYAPNVLLAYHISVWGTGNDIVYTNPPDATVDQLATRAATFFNSLSPGFDLAFAEFSDRDAGFKQAIYGDGGASWWDSADFARNRRFLARFVQLSGRRVAMWQIPLGNTKMRALNNSWNHYQDNRPEWLLDEPARSHLQDYINAGVVAFLFGRGADGATCACDANADGTTNPAPINGNTLTSLNADDDGGFFRQKAQTYYTTGAMSLAGGAPAATATATRSSTPAGPTSTPTRTPTRTNTPAGSPSTPTRTSTAAPPAPTSTAAPVSYTTNAAVVPSTIGKGNSVAINFSVRAGAPTSALVDIEVYNSAGAKVFQQWFDNQSFAAGQTRQYSSTWSVPAGATTGTHTVKVGVFAPGWSALRHWNNGAATFAVQP
jgi:hypothetical protein